MKHTYEVKREYIDYPTTYSLGFFSSRKKAREFRTLYIMANKENLENNERVVIYQHTIE